jgi:putative holliday junction resolvase
MARILCFDYGIKRIGVAVTDPLQLIASALTTVDRDKIFDFIKEYIKYEEVECFVVGYPTPMENTSESHSKPHIDKFIAKLKEMFKGVPVELEDEHFSSKLAIRAMIDGGLKKKQRQNKATIDKVSASIILYNFLDRKKKGQ